MAPVTLRVYDLSRGLAAQLSPSLLGSQIDGVWHSGVLVHGDEFFFGGGLQVMAPALVEARYGMRPAREIPLGDTQVSRAELERFLRAASPRFTAQTYDLLRHNCNHFADELARFLLGHGIPQFILDLPDRVLRSPFGCVQRGWPWRSSLTHPCLSRSLFSDRSAVLRPMLENMQGQMGAATDAMPFANPFNDASRAAAPAPAPAPVADLSSRRFKVSGNAQVHLDAVVERVAQLSPAGAALSVGDLEQLRSVAAHFKSANAGNEADAATRLAWWSALHKALSANDARLLFPALAIFRVLLLEPSPSAEVTAVKDRCFDALVQTLEAEKKSPALTDAQKILVLSVLINAFANRTASDLVLARAVQFLPFVFKAIVESLNHEVKVLCATLISNCCLALKIEEEVVITTIICGAVETLERLSQQVQTSVSPEQANTIEGVVAGVGQLLRNFEGARALSVELGLADVLGRFNLAPGLGSLQPLLSELTTLM